MDLSANKCKLPELHIGNKTARLPIIQGGMGVVKNTALKKEFLHNFKYQKTPK